MTLFKLKLNDLSNQCPQLARGPEHLASPRRRNEIHQIDPNWIKWNWAQKRETWMKSWNTYLQYTDNFPFLVSGVVRVSHFSKPAGICWNLTLVASLGRAEWRVYGVLFFTTLLLVFSRSEHSKLSSSSIFNHYGHVWSQLSCHAIYCHLFMWDVCFFPRNIRITPMHFEWLMRSVRLVRDHELSFMRLNGTNGQKRCVEFDAVRSSTC